MTTEPKQGEAYLAAEVCRYLREIHPQMANLRELGERFHISPFHLQRQFKRATGISPREYAAELRLSDFKTQVRQGERIADAIYAAGYSSSSRLYEKSDEKLGMTPSTYRRLGQGMTIFYSVVTSPLGQLLAAATERGLCKISLGEDAGDLIAGLDAEFARAERIRDDDGLGGWLQNIIAWLEGWQPNLDLPLDLRATAFQLKVWAALQAIPRGETRSYKQIATAIGNPKASRAVASACASNPVALVIPCHRVVHSNGELGGYRWGIERKRALLQAEGAEIERL